MHALFDEILLAYLSKRPLDKEFLDEGFSHLKTIPAPVVIPIPVQPDPDEDEDLEEVPAIARPLKRKAQAGVPKAPAAKKPRLFVSPRNDVVLVVGASTEGNQPC